MKKTGKKPSAKKPAAKAAAKKTAKPAPKAKAAKPAAKSGPRSYTPQPIQGIGWAPFRYPLT